MDVPDRGCQAGRDREVDTRDRDQPLDGRVSQRAVRNGCVEHRQIFAKPVEFAQVALDRDPLIVRKGLARKPSTADAAEQIRVRTMRNEVGVQDRVDLVLDPRPMPDDLVATATSSAAAPWPRPAPDSGRYPSA